MTNLLSLTIFLVIFEQLADGNATQATSEVVTSNVVETTSVQSEAVKSEAVKSDVVNSEASTPVVEPNLKSKDVNTTENEVDEIEDESWEFENTTVIDTRRILYSKRVKPGARPYMVYLQLTKESAKAHKYRGWLCGGVIVDQFYVLTSAACVEDAEHFYIVSGTTRFVDSFDYKTNECACKNRRKVVWKCIPKNYKFDFQDSIKWSSNDIAIVKVDKAFKFGVTEKGCEFATDLVCYNNCSRELEKPGTKGFIAGWGSGNTFREGVYRRQKESNRPENAKCLQEAKVCVMDNEQCAKKWAQRFQSIITQYMICTKDVMKRLSELCDKKYANCTDVESRRQVEYAQEKVSRKTLNIDLGRHLRDPDDYTARRSSLQGGFCENDHGGPLIVKYQNKERVTGVISACKIDPKSHSCHGPFLYTSVFRNRQFISCAIQKDVEDNCRRVFRTGITHEEYSVDWRSVADDDDTYDPKDDKAIKEDLDSDRSQTSSIREHNTTGNVLRAEEFITLEDRGIPDTRGVSLNQPTEKTGERHKKGNEKKISDNDHDLRSKDDGDKTSLRAKDDPETPKEVKSTDTKKDDSEVKDKEDDTDKAEKDKTSKKETAKAEHGTRKKRDDVFYESSRDDNVNEPEEDNE